MAQSRTVFGANADHYRNTTPVPARIDISPQLGKMDLPAPLVAPELPRVENPYWTISDERNSCLQTRYGHWHLESILAVESSLSPFALAYRRRLFSRHRTPRFCLSAWPIAKLSQQIKSSESVIHSRDVISAIGDYAAGAKAPALPPPITTRPPMKPTCPHSPPPSPIFTRHSITFTNSPWIIRRNCATSPI